VAELHKLTARNASLSRRIEARFAWAKDDENSRERQHAERRRKVMGELDERRRHIEAREKALFENDKERAEKIETPEKLSSLSKDHHHHHRRQ
jgi:hypothetical protein